MDVRLVVVHQVGHAREIRPHNKTYFSMTQMLLAFGFLISNCSSPQMKRIDIKTDTSVNPSKVLIVYLSRTNNTKAIAEMIHRNAGGTLVALELEKP